MYRSAGVAALVVAGSALAPAPPARADGFVDCGFSLAKPFVYSVDGADYMGSRVDVTDCRTDLPAAQLNFQMHLTATGAPLDLAGPEHTLSYYEVREVRNGDSFSVSFPNDARLMPLYSGVYGAKVTARTGLADDADPRFHDYQCSTWEFPGMNCTPAAHI